MEEVQAKDKRNTHKDHQEKEATNRYCKLNTSAKITRTDIR